jgi:DNA-binding CsgD family transcriptional regulator
MVAIPIGFEAPPLSRHRRARASARVDADALAELVAAPADAVAERARNALWPVLPHTALVLVTPGSPTFPVQIAAPRQARQRLAAIEWTRMLGVELPTGSDVARLDLPGVLGGLRAVGWVARSGGFTVAMIVGDRAGMNITPDQEHAAIDVVMQAAARVHAIDHDPPPGTLALSRAISHERERLSLELRSRHAATLSSLLHTLRDPAHIGGSQPTPPGVAKAIDMASRALLDLRAEADAGDASGRILIGAAFVEIENEVRATLHSAGIRLVADLDADETVQVAYAVAHAARLVTRAAGINATEHAGADKLRLRWHLTDQALEITVADNGVGIDHAAERFDHQFSAIRRLAGELRGRVDLDFNPNWGTTLRCSLPLHDLAATPEIPAARRLAELRDREREVLELMIAGLRNRDIASRLFITEHTVKFHIAKIFDKLGVGSRTEAIALAHRAGISTAPTTTGP